MQTIEQRLRSIRRSARAVQAFCVVWALLELGFVLLGMTTDDRTEVVSHGFAFVIAVLMMILMATAGRVFRQDILQVAREAPNAAPRR